MNDSYHISIKNAIGLLKGTRDQFVEVMKDGKMTIEYYAPIDIDHQQPHNRDEIYIIASGESRFKRNGVIIKCAQGDVIFVPAKMEHRFIDFSQDFATWVIFYGDES